MLLVSTNIIIWTIALIFSIAKHAPIEIICTTVIVVSIYLGVGIILMRLDQWLKKLSVK